MIPPEFILETSATMIVGVLFIVTIAQAMKWEYIASKMFGFILFGVLPFSASAILVLLDYYEAARLACIIGFVLFTFYLASITYSYARREQ